MSTVISKSVGRAFALLELYRHERRPLTASAIEAALELPQASALVLARELTSLGYLNFDPESRSYFPSERLAELTAWLATADLPGRRLRDLVDDVSRATGETTSLCMRNGRHLQIEYFALGSEPGGILMRKGRAAPLPCSGAGRAVLATLPAREAQAVIEEVASRDAARYPLDAADAAHDVRVARRRGWLATYDLMLPGVGAVAFPLPRDAAGGCFALVVGAPTPRVRANRARIVEAAAAILARRFPRGPR
jgi:DNA-binding IclR family transcriptional regulator